MGTVRHAVQLTTLEDVSWYCPSLPHTTVVSPSGDGARYETAQAGVHVAGLSVAKRGSGPSERSTP